MMKLEYVNVFPFIIKLLSKKFPLIIASKTLSMFLKNKLGYYIDVKIREVAFNEYNEKTHIHIVLDGEISRKELIKVLQDVGLDL